jgi:beta-1,4-mannosyltransferase
MQYHALALASSLAEVDVVGYAGSTPHHTIRDHAHIHWYRFQPLQRWQHNNVPRFPFLGYAVLKVLYECLQLLWLLLFVIARPDIVLVQNPPAMPTLLIAWLVARLRSARLVVDWHNFGYSMLALRLGCGHPVVRLARWYEGAVGRRADAHLCVSQAMQVALAEQWRIANAVVLYDRPAAVFVPTPPQQSHELLQRLHDTIAFPAITAEPEAPERPALLISPTSWSADEDFELLLAALHKCAALMHHHDRVSAAQPFPHLLVLLTGQGPRRASYEQHMQGLTLHKIHLRTLWLSAEDYALLLGAADLGLCVHRSASGVDLPMKVMDMFGAGVPVCALDYGPCLTEQVRHGENGLLFSSSTQLASLLYDLFKGFPNETPLLDHLRRNMRASRGESWGEVWRKHALPLFTSL